MSVKIYINSQDRGKGLAQVKSRYGSSSPGRRTRIEDILDLMDAVYMVPYLMASGSTVGRGVSGPGYNIVPNDIEVSGSRLKKKKIQSFMNYSPVVQRNIKDTFSPTSKIYTTAFMFRVFGQTAWEIVRESGTGRPLGFDLIPGVVRPNVEPDGSFIDPAYTQYIKSGGVVSKYEYRNPSDVIFFAIPDFSSNIWLSEAIALTEYTLPSELYSARAFRDLHKNRNAPYSGFWYTPSDIDDDTFDRFVDMISSRYTGASAYGRNPVIMKGEGGFKSISVPKEEAPYIEGREMNRNEIAAGTGVPGEKYGVGLKDLSGDTLRELRREFYETTIRPVTSVLEEIIYHRICVGLFDAPEWRVKFYRPDFTTAIEDASIELRRIQWGQWSPNEARASRGESPRDGGDYYLIPSNMVATGKDAPGRPTNDPVDDDSGDMEPIEEDPVPGTEPPERPNGGKLLSPMALVELKNWKRFEQRVVSGTRDKRDFVTEYIPEVIADMVRELLDAAVTQEDIASIFDDVMSII